MSDLTPPQAIYEPVLLNAETLDVEGQAGAFRSEVEARKVLERWREEGVTQEMAVNVVGLFDSFEEWLANR